MKKVKVTHPRTDKLITVKPWFPTVVMRSWDDYTQPERKPYGHQQSVEHEDAEIQSLDHMSRFMLRAAIDKDDETDDYFDMDGDRALDRLIMERGTVLFFDSHSISVEGLVPKKAEDDDDEDWKNPWQLYRKERWTMYRRKKGKK